MKKGSRHEQMMFCHILSPHHSMRVYIHYVEKGVTARAYAVLCSGRLTRELSDTYSLPTSLYACIHTLGGIRVTAWASVALCSGTRARHLSSTYTPIFSPHIALCVSICIRWKKGQGKSKCRFMLLKTPSERYNISKVTATHCNTLQHTATHCTTHCSTLQHTETHCNTLQHTAQHTAAHCNTLQHTATHCDTLQHTVPRCTSLHRAATQWNMTIIRISQKSSRC